MEAILVSSDDEDIEMMSPERRVKTLEKRLKDWPFKPSILTPEHGTPAFAKIKAMIIAKAAAIHDHRTILVRQVRRDKKAKGETYPSPCTAKSFKAELQSFDSKQNQDFNAPLAYYGIAPNIKLLATWIHPNDTEGYIEELEDVLSKHGWLTRMSYTLYFYQSVSKICFVPQTKSSKTMKGRR